MGVLRLFMFASEVFAIIRCSTNEYLSCIMGHACNAYNVHVDVSIDALKPETKGCVLLLLFYVIRSHNLSVP